MPIVPPAFDLGGDEESQSGIFTTDGQSTILASAEHGGVIGMANAAVDDTLDYQSLISGIEDTSFLMNESLYRAKLREEETMVRAEYSLADEESTTDYGDYATMPYPSPAAQQSQPPTTDDHDNHDPVVVVGP